MKRERLDDEDNVISPKGLSSDEPQSKQPRKEEERSNPSTPLPEKTCPGSSNNVSSTCQRSTPSLLSTSEAQSLSHPSTVLANCQPKIKYGNINRSSPVRKPSKT